MKQRNRQRYLLNLFSFVLLAIALYLNFIKKDADASMHVEQSKKPASQHLKVETQRMSVNNTTQTFVLK